GQRYLHRDKRTKARISGLQLEARQTVGHRVRPGASISVKVHAQQVDFAELRGDLAGREFGVFKPVADLIDDVLGDVLAYRRGDRPLLIGELRPDVNVIQGVDFAHGVVLPTEFSIRSFSMS